ncbi:glycosyltransferase family 39 protein [Phycisphaerales bacterium AB-hyl4]|uniref:Glycosyltransferase family 39 protein n=1 Tax=Natronomicrosphaera hydrolytica TaxID=3242702 RepID=A0ABV4U4G8_9BACT
MTHPPQQANVSRSPTRADPPPPASPSINDVELARILPLPPRIPVWLFALMLIIATAIGAGARLYQLGEHSFWADELYSIHSITDAQPPPIWRVLAHSATWAGLQFTGADLAAASHEAPEQWRELGINEWSARIGPALLGILSIPVLAIVGRRVLGDRGAIAFALLLAVLPWHVEWSQNARFYVGLFLFYGLSVLLYFDATTRPSRARMVVAMLCFVFAFLHHPPGIFLVGLFVADWLMSRAMRDKPRLGWFGYTSVAVAVGLCLTVLAIDMHTMAAGYDRLEDQPRGHGPGMLLAGTAYLLHPALLTLALLSAWLLITRRERLGGYLLIAAAVPLAALAWLSFTDRMFVHTRYGFMASVGYIALAAVGLDRLYSHVAPRFGRAFAAGPAAALLAALGLSLGFYHAGGQGFRSSWDHGFAYAQQHRQPGDIVATPFTLAGRYYLQTADVAAMPPTADRLDQLSDQGQTIWLVTAVESAQGVDPAQQWLHNVATLEAYFDSRIEQPFSSIRVYRYEGRSNR